MGFEYKCPYCFGPAMKRGDEVVCEGQKHCMLTGAEDDFEIINPNEVVFSEPEKTEYQLVKERDRAEWWADRLAGAIAHMLQIEIGERSSNNCPWQNALESCMSETGFEVDMSQDW